MVRNIAIFVMLFILACCSSGAPQENVEVGLLAAVPSDAVAVARCESTINALQQLTSESCPLRDVDYGRLAKAPAAVSLSYVSSLVPLLVIDAGRDVSDTTAAVASVLEDLSAKGLPSTLASFEGRKILLASTSDTVLPLAQRHLDIDASILDADGFDLVLENIAHSRNTLILRNSAALRLLKGGLPELFGMPTLLKAFPSRSLASFLQGASLWATVDLDKNELTPIQRDDMSFFCNFFRTLPSGRSLLELPDSADFSLEVMTGEGFRAKYETWLDATSKIEPYKRTVAALRKESGKDPLKWEKELGVGEVARVCWEGHEVVLLGFPRGKAPKNAPAPQVEANPYPGFIKALYCSLSTDDSCYARTATWAVFGKEPDVRAYLDSDKCAASRKEFSCMMAMDGLALVSDKVKTAIIRK